MNYEQIFLLWGGIDLSFEVFNGSRFSVSFKVQSPYSYTFWYVFDIRFITEPNLSIQAVNYIKELNTLYPASKALIKLKSAIHKQKHKEYINETSVIT